MTNKNSFINSSRGNSILNLINGLRFLIKARCDLQQMVVHCVWFKFFKLIASHWSTANLHLIIIACVNGTLRLECCTVGNFQNVKLILLHRAFIRLAIEVLRNSRSRQLWQKKFCSTDAPGRAQLPKQQGGHPRRLRFTHHHLLPEG